MRTLPRWLAVLVALVSVALTSTPSSAAIVSDVVTISPNDRTPTEFPTFTTPLSVTIAESASEGLFGQHAFPQFSSVRYAPSVIQYRRCIDEARWQHQ